MRGKFGLLALAAVMACQPQPATMSDAQKAALTDSIKAFAMGMVDKMNKGDMKGAMASNSMDASARYTQNGVMLDAAGMAKMNQDMAPMMQGMQIKPEKADVILLGPDAAVINSPYAITMKSAAGKEVSGKGVWTGIVQRQAGTWRVVSTHISDVNAEDMMKAMMAPAPKGKGGKAPAKAPAKSTKKK